MLANNNYSGNTDTAAMIIKIALKNHVAKRGGACL